MKTKTADNSPATVDRLEGSRVVLILADGKELIVSRKFFKFIPREGDSININFSLNQAQTKTKQQQAQKLLSSLE